jgi:hypothetical protein
MKKSNETSKNLVFVMNSIAVMTEGTKVKHEKDVLPQVGADKKIKK